MQLRSILLRFCPTYEVLSQEPAGEHLPYRYFVEQLADTSGISLDIREKAAVLRDAHRWIVNHIDDAPSSVQALILGLQFGWSHTPGEPVTYTTAGNVAVEFSGSWQS